jgi:hypothetical protein
MSSAGWTRWQRISSRTTEAGKSITPKSFITNASSKEVTHPLRRAPLRSSKPRGRYVGALLSTRRWGRKLSVDCYTGSKGQSRGSPARGHVGGGRKRIRRCRPGPREQCWIARVLVSQRSVRHRVSIFSLAMRSVTPCFFLQMAKASGP